MAPSVPGQPLLTGVIQTAELQLDRPRVTPAEPAGLDRWRLDAVLYLLPQTDKRLVILSQQTEIIVTIPGLIEALHLNKQLRVWAPVVHENIPYLIRMDEPPPPRQFESPLVQSSESEVILDGPGRVKLWVYGYSDPIDPLPDVREAAAVTIQLYLHLMAQPLVIEGILPTAPSERQLLPPTLALWRQG